MRADVSFLSGGLVCRGWLYRPQGGGAGLPGIVMSHGFSAVKEQGLAGFAERFCAAGFVVLAFDYRFLGSSDGEERGRIIPWEQHDDLRAAIGFLSAQRGVDPARIGLWGTSYSGGHALFVGAFDPRVKVVVAQVPAIAVTRALIDLVGAEGFAGYLGLFADDFARRNAGETGGRIPIVAPAGQPSVLSTPDSLNWFVHSPREPGAGWVNQASLESVARMAEYAPAAFVDLLSPKPLLLLAGETDQLIPVAQVREAFARAGEPKHLEVYPCGHFDLYPGRPFHDLAAASATEWFARHLAA